jgi:hypothetical protein
MTTYESAAGAQRAPVQHADDRRSLRRSFTEAKNGFKTSEFYLTIVAIAGVLIATYLDNDDSLSVDDGFRYASWIAAAYIISRGLAKLGTSEPYSYDD